MTNYKLREAIIAGQAAARKKPGRPRQNQTKVLHDVDGSIEWLNKTEARFSDYLRDLKAQGSISRYGYERQRFRVGKASWYTPDFYSVDHLGRVTYYEVKACKGRLSADGMRYTGSNRPLMTAASRRGLRSAADFFPHFNWRLCWESWGVKFHWELEAIE